MPAVLVLGSVNVDLVIRNDRLPRPGETIIGGEFYRAAGGKGANQAVAAARATARAQSVAFVAAVGDDDFGREALAGLERDGIDTRHVLRVARQPTGAALILVGGGENLISVTSGANATLSPTRIDALPDALFATAKVLLAGFESPLPAVLRGLQRAKHAGLLTILNPAPAVPLAMCRDILPLIDVLVPNEHEAALLTDRRVTSAADAIAAGRVLQQAGAKEVIVTLGAHGAVWVAADAVHIPARPVAAVDTVAAGDAFCGAFAGALAEGRSTLDAIHFASAAAAISVTRLGAQPSLPQRDEITSLLAQAPARSPN